MKNLIYICVFFQEDYIKLVELLLKSIYKNGNIDSNTDILIMTTFEYKKILELKIESFNLPIKYWLMNNYSFCESCFTRLQIFQYENINVYDKILYLDTDVLINSDMNVLLNQDILKDKLYAVQEGTIGHEHYGSMFFDFEVINKETTAFSSGVLYFKNSEEIKTLFSTISTHINDYLHIKGNAYPETMDQPFFVFNAIIKNQYDNTFLLDYGENNPKEPNPTKIIYHFPGGIGQYYSKIDKMNHFWNKM